MYFIFSFSYLSKENYSILKNKINSYNEDAKITLLTKNNFNSYFHCKFNNLKKILYGKYLLISIENNSNLNSIEEIVNQVNNIVSFLSTLNFELKILLTIHNDNIYFYDILNKANSFKTISTYNSFKTINQLNYYNNLNLNYLLSNKFISNLNNISLLNNNTNYLISYLY